MRIQNFLSEDVLAGLGLISASSFFLLSSFYLDFESSIFPRVILLFCIVLSIVLIGQDVSKRAKGEKSAFTDAFKNFKKVTYSLILVFLYIVSVNFIGFYVSTFIMIPIVSRMFGYKKLVHSIAWSALYTGLLFVVFSQLMDRYMPSGILI